MASKDELLEAENNRLTNEMASMKKKIVDVLTKQQAELQAKIEAAEQRASVAEAASSNSTSQSEEITSEAGELQEIESKQVQDLKMELNKLRTTVEERNKELSAMDDLAKANEKLEAQVMAAASQAADALSRVSEMHDELQSMSRERDAVRLAYTDLENEHQRVSMELKHASNGAASKDQIQACSTTNDDLERISDRNNENIPQEIDALRAEVLELKNANKLLRQNFSDPLSLVTGEPANFNDQLQTLMEENATLKDKLERDKKEHQSKYAELESKFSRLQKRAKQRIQDVQKEKDELEAQLTTKHANLQNDLDRFRAQAGDAIRALDAERQNLRNANLKLQEEMEESKRLLDLKEHNLAESRRLASEKDQTALNMQAEMKEVEAKHASAISVLIEKHTKAVEELEDQLNDAKMEMRKLTDVITAQQAQLALKESKLADAEAAVTGEVARLSATVEAAKLEARSMKEEQDNERQQWDSKAAKYVSKIQELETACQQIEQAALESKRRWENDIEAVRKELADAQKKASTARNEADRLNKDFTAYKVRAHALLQKKEAELQEARDVDLAAAQEASLKDAQREAAAAAAERDRAISSLRQAVAEYEIQLAARNVAVVDAEQRIKDLATKLESTKGSLAYEREEWQKHSQRLDSSWREKYEELAKKKQVLPADEKSKSELAMLQIQYEQLKGDYDSFRDMANQMMEAKDQEIEKLLEDNNKLHESQSQEVVNERDGDMHVEVIPVAEQQILILARQQAQREEEVKQCQRQIEVLQEEISDLENQNRLHRQQDALLKEELRNMERCTKRNGVDMTYLKNVILKLLETGEAEALLPVVGTLLQFSPDEVKRCQEAYANASATDISGGTPRSLLSRFNFSNGR